MFKNDLKNALIGFISLMLACGIFYTLFIFTEEAEPVDIYSNETATSSKPGAENKFKL
jgi:hypothetical protein